MLLQSQPRAAARIATDARALAQGATETFVFLLLDGFDALALAGATEPLRQANAISGRPLYGWRIVTMAGTPAVAIGGLAVLADDRFAGLGRGETLMVIGAAGEDEATRGQVFAALRREAAHGARIGAIGAGIQTLARAGLLDNETVAAHWDVAEGMAEEFPRIEVSRAAFVAGRRPTAPGGAAATDLMLHLIAERHGANLATRIADAMVWANVRGPQSRQTVSAQSRFGVRNARLVRVLAAMEANLETPLSAQEIADIAGMSPRQTERLFSRYLATTPMGFYAHLRLERARSLLMQTELSVTEVAVACGYRSLSHFAKVYRATYGHAPRRMRAVA
ncbi:GlxA family transcriptional regulator [Albidovulum sp.]|uniref:GlxA family transcriptional regulator n=1 Tax=Albidovulum sp. TaxID=1872424 RepID=UPI001DB8C305|nr:GlxA family transcriptional regulator [Paracoccaceae bacterium]MCC0046185.1 GlxA family transcriptional regulator [Defluviimonas sp.]HPE26197.1 GlxA family transcriptional regulator [Albidovulum sp.]MCB2144313.1 GlxA family transcriptional regulator [Paracoccaceae bacterium]MCB2150456.1 GlxA family transcriptional regulator [Paracoccaceae bacterium]